ncbi:hypothetical protein [Massilia haematophila]|uniref:Prolin-rich transmembrane protein n=1 Tax=Massilia haematophila TaxID=457923 RepID=A0ABV7PCH3_9BURK
MKPRHIALGLALAIAAALAAFGDKAPEAEVAEAVERPAAVPVAANAQRPSSGAREPVILRLQPRDELVGDAGKADGDALFARQDWTPPPPPPPPQESGPPPPPVAPRLPYSFIGKSLEEGKWEVYLASGERTHIAVEGGVIDGAWRVERIAPPLLTLTYLPLNQVQQLNIGAFD